MERNVTANKRLVLHLTILFNKFIIKIEGLLIELKYFSDCTHISCINEFRKFINVIYGKLIIKYSRNYFVENFLKLEQESVFNHF